MRLPLRLAALAGALLTASITANAQTVVRLVTQGDQVPGNGKVTVIDNIAVNDFGGWLAEVRTDLTDTSMNKVLLANGQVLLTKGQVLAGTGGATLSKFDAVTLNNAGNAGLNLEMNGTAQGAEEGIFWNDKMVIQSGSPVGAPGVGAGTTYVAFDEVRINNSEQLLVIARIEDPTMALSIERVIVVLDTDGNGNLTGESLVEVTGASFPPPSGPVVADFYPTAHFYSFNDLGSAIYGVRLDTGSGANDEAIAIDRLAVAEEGFPSPIAGRNWGSFSTPEMGLNNNGDWVLSITLDGSLADDAIIVKNNVKVAQEGDQIIQAGGYALKSFGSGPVEIGDNGDVLWYGLWNDPSTATDSGLLINSNLVIHEGVTMSGTNVIKSLIGLIDGYHLSSGGNVLIFEGILDTGDSAVMQVIMSTPSGGPGTLTCSGDGASGACPCGNNSSTGQGCLHSGGLGGALSASGSSSLGAADLGFTATQLPANRIALLVTGTATGGGVFGDGMLCVGGSWTALQARMSSGSGSASWNTASLANGTFGAGQTHQFQVLFRDPAGPCASAFGSSAGYQVPFVQ